MADLDYEGFWNETLIHMRDYLGEEEFSIWFSDFKYLRSSFDEKTGKGGVIIGTPSSFHRDKVKARYHGVIISKIKEIAGKEIAIDYEITGKTAKKDSEHPQSAAKNEGAANVSTAETQKTKKPREKHPQLRDDFVFDRYVKGENNAFATNAAIAISKNPGKTYNPFLIFGGVGLGKTHLMQAIGNSIYETSDHEVIYITSENFLNEYVQAIQDGKMPNFKNKFRYTDVLLIDDIQFFQNKDRIQEELFHTFNALLDAKKQLVFTCDRPPSELKKMEERLRSRFDQCLKVDLQPPRYEERCAILRATAENKNVQIPNEIIDLVSKNISSNVRDLISALNTLIAYTELMGQPITLEIAQQRLKSIFFRPRQENLSIENITRVVADYFSLTPNDLKGKKKTQNIVFPRQLAMYIGRDMTDYSTTELGQEFGGRDHTTVMHSIKIIKDKLLTDPSLESTIDIIKQNIKEFSAKY
jgi:chromosomal replication initiator protein